MTNFKLGTLNCFVFLTQFENKNTGENYDQKI